MAIRRATQPCAADSTLLCFGDDSTPANGLNGAQLGNPFVPGAILGEIDRTTTRSTTQASRCRQTNNDQLFGHNNHFGVGTSFDSQRDRFSASAELGTIAQTTSSAAAGYFLAIRRSVSIGPVALRTTNQYSGLYVLRYVRHTNAFSITGGGRYKRRTYRSRGPDRTALNGNEMFTALIRSSAHLTRSRGS